MHNWKGRFSQVCNRKPLQQCSGFCHLLFLVPPLGAACETPPLHLARCSRFWPLRSGYPYFPSHWVQSLQIQTFFFVKNFTKM